MATPEGRVKRKVTRLLKQTKAYYLFPATGGYGRSGIPDIIVCIHGKFIGIECKADNKGQESLTPLQKKARDDILIAGGDYFLVNNNDETLIDLRKTLEHEIKRGKLQQLLGKA